MSANSYRTCSSLGVPHSTSTLSGSAIARPHRTQWPPRRRGSAQSILEVVCVCWIDSWRRTFLDRDPLLPVLPKRRPVRCATQSSYLTTPRSTEAQNARHRLQVFTRAEDVIQRCSAVVRLRVVREAMQVNHGHALLYTESCAPSSRLSPNLRSKAYLTSPSPQRRCQPRCRRGDRQRALATLPPPMRRRW